MSKPKKNTKPTFKELNKRLADAVEREKAMRDRVYSLIDHLMQNDFFKDQITDYLKNEIDFVDDIRAELEDEIREQIRQEIIDEIS